METKVEEISINGVSYVPKSSVVQQEIKGDIKIVILQRGWNMIGRFEKNGNECKLHDAYVIRRWGTTQGLGELAINGKQPNTVLDKCGGVVGFDYLTVVATIDCEESKWQNEL